MSTSFIRVVRRSPDDIKVTVRRDCCASGCEIWKPWQLAHSYEGISHATPNMIRGDKYAPISAFYYALPVNVNVSQLERRIGVTTL